MIIFDKIVDHANKNKIPDILIQYYYRRNALDMKLLRDKFNHWRNLLPYMRLDDAASRIQAMLRGFLLRKDFDRFNRLTETMYKIVIKIIERHSILPHLHKWNKNARKLKCIEDAKIIQELCRKNLTKRLRSNAMKDLKQLFVVIPNDNSISNIFDAILNLMTERKAETARLTALRDKLLPLLMNGQVEVA